MRRRNADYWTAKLGRNVERDRAANEFLAAAGWTVVRIWEHVSPAVGAEHVVSALAVVDATRRLA